MHSTPATLLERVRQPSDAAAWREFVHLYTPLLFFWAKRLGLQSADAADLVQEVFLALCNALPQFTYDRQRSFRSWLFTLMRNKWLDWKRRRVPLPAGTVEGTLADRPDVDGVAALEENEYRSQLCARALRLIQSEFAPATWRAFWATVVEGRPAVDVAREFGLTPNAVYLARGRILRRLRAELDGLLD
jgi:RNA polymerase sigma-70 factor (ECF subfamily)